MQEKEKERAGQSIVPRLASRKESGEVQRNAVIKQILFRIDNKNDSPALALFQLNMTEWGYEKEIMKTP